MEPVNPNPFDVETTETEAVEKTETDSPEASEQPEVEETDGESETVEHTGFPHPDDVPGVGPGSFPAEQGKP